MRIDHHLTTNRTSDPISNKSSGDTSSSTTTTTTTTTNIESVGHHKPLLNGQSRFFSQNNVMKKVNVTSQASNRSASDDSIMNRKKLSHPNGQTNNKTTTATEQQQQSDQNQNQQQQQPEEPTATTNDEIKLFVRNFVVNCAILLIKSIISSYDLISQPIYYLKHRVYEKQHQVDRVVRSKQLDPTNPNSPWKQFEIPKSQRDIETQIDSHETYDQLVQSSINKFKTQPCYAYRRILHEQWVKKSESDKKLLRQVKLSEYNWVTYEQFDRQIEAACKGLLLEGIKPGDKVMLYADTRAEWQISSQALIRLGAVVVTMYSTLGIDGIIHCVNETQVTHVIAQKDKVIKLLKLKDKLPLLKKVIHLETYLTLPDGLQVDRHQDKVPSDGEWPKEFEHKQVECMSFTELLHNGILDTNQAKIDQLWADNRKLREARRKDSIAVIMYTSGSTGIPKGVLISHGNIMATIKSFSYVTKDFVFDAENNIGTAYLPLAHIFEFCIESMLLYHGVRFGFATPHTLTDKSPGLIPGQKGDLTILQPTVLIIVPLILDRIVQGVKQVLKSGSYFKEKLVSFLIDYKIYWQQRHYETPLVDKIVCSKIAAALGGRAKWVICGSAPLSSETQKFVRAALNLKLPQGFGTTETSAATSCQLFEDQSTSNVGLPVSGALIKLEPWLEGNYRPTDKPNPRGEIVVGGQMIAHGYFNLDEQTKEAFYVDEDGVRWYRTGDIGEFLPNGNLKIIDRKKDLVKLQNGEFISLGKVESTLKSNPYTDNFCVYANPNYNYVVALGPANEVAIKNLAESIVDEHLRRSPSFEAKKEDNDALLRLSVGPALEELKEILASYESDLLNNNNDDMPNGREVLDRKMSSLSTTSNSPGSCTNERLKRLCDNQLVHERVLSYIHDLARERNLMTLEIPKKLLLLAEEWTEDKNLVTAAMKIRRNYIYKRYEDELIQLYRSPDSLGGGASRRY